MSIVVSGSLTIREIFGRHGPFKVGRLLTSLGDFSVKDALLDQYNPGTYEGNFGISRIYPSYYMAGGRIIVEVRASIVNMMLSGIDDQPPKETVFIEPDPVDTDIVVPASHQPSFDTQSEHTIQNTSTDKSEIDPDSELFGLLMPLGDSVKLDPTVKRTILRVQCERLKALGYQFQPATQTWCKN